MSDRDAANDRKKIEVYDTTLRDGSQLEGISLTVDDKLRIAEQLDWLGVDFIEAGWPGANPKDDEMFRRAPHELKLDTSTLVAFGSTRRVKGKVDSDDTLRNLLEAGTSTVCIVGKSWDYHVLEALQTTLDEGVAMVADSVAFLRGDGRACLAAFGVSACNRRCGDHTFFNAPCGRRQGAGADDCRTAPAADEFLAIG